MNLTPLQVKQLQTQVKTEKKKRKLKRSLFEFLKEYWPIIIPDPFVYNWHIEYLCEELKILGQDIIERKPKRYDLAINISPGTTKSTICSVMFPVWLWANDPSIRIINSAYSSGASVPHAVKSRQIIESPEFQKVFPHVELRPDNNVKSNYETTENGIRIATSSGASITSKHADVIIIDDPHKPPQKNQAGAEPNEIIKDNNWNSGTLMTRKTNKENVPVITVMQRLHEMDYTGHQLAKKGKRIKHICLPAKISNNVKPEKLKEKYVNGLFDPKRMSEKVLEEIKIDLGSQQFASQFGQRPAPEEGNIIKGAYFGYFQEEDIPENVTMKFYSDTAYGTENSDNSATLAGFQYKGNLYITNCWAVKKPFPEFIKDYKRFLEANGYKSNSSCIFEPKASGLDIVQQLKTERLSNGSYINIREDNMPSGSKISRVKAMSAMLEAGRVKLLQNSHWVDEFITECKQFPNGKNDDRVDALTGLMRNTIASQNNFIIKTS